MIYNGLIDVIIAWPLTESFLTSINDWTDHNEYLDTESVKWTGDSGHVNQVANFTQILIRNTGHMVPHDQPKPEFRQDQPVQGGQKVLRLKRFFGMLYTHKLSDLSASIGKLAKNCENIFDFQSHLWM